MRKRIFFLALALTILLTGCGAPAQPEVPPADGAVTFTDDLGREVTVEPPERVAALIGSFADIWCLAGGKDTLVAAAHDSWTQFDLGLDDTVADLGGVKETNLEALLAAKPDFVLASSNTEANVALLDTLEAAGIPCAYFTVAGFDDYLRLLDICCRLTGQEENFRQYGEALRQQVDDAKARADGSAPRVLYVRATGASVKVKNSRDSVLGEMLADLGAVNIADGGSGLLEELSMEVIIREDPEHIFVVIQGSDPAPAEKLLRQTLLDNPAWEGLTAVKEGRFHVMDPQLYNTKPNARWGEAYEHLSQILYP